MGKDKNKNKITISVINGPINDPQLVPLNQTVLQIVNVYEEGQKEIAPSKIDLKKKTKDFELEEGKKYKLSFVKTTRQATFQGWCEIRVIEKGIEILKYEGDCGKFRIQIVP